MSGSGLLVSVGIVTWNSRSLVGECLAALEAETGDSPFRVETVVVDNASSDGTAELVAREFPSVRMVRNGANLGFAAAANRVVRETAGEFVLLLNPDCRIRPGYVTTLVEALESRGSLHGAAGGKLVLEGGVRDSKDADDRGRADVIDSAGLELTLSLRVRDRGHGQPDRGRFDADEEVFGVCAAAALYRRAMLDDLRRRTGHVFDEAFGSYKEDADLAWRARRLGWRSLYVADAVAEHRRGFAASRRAEVPAWLRRQSFRNRYLLVAKNATLGDVVRGLPFIAAFEIGSLGYAVVRDRALLGAYAEAARLAAGALAERRRPRPALEDALPVPTRSLHDVIRVADAVETEAVATPGGDSH